MPDELPGLQSKVTIDPTGVDKGLDHAISKIHKFSNEADRSLNAFSKRVNTAFSQITGGNATERLRVLEQAIAKAGGTSNIAAPQLERLRKEITALAAAGGKVPSALAGLQQVEAQTSKLQQAGLSLAQGGGISGALASIGPAGAAAAGGVTLLTGAFIKLGQAVIAAVQSVVQKTGALSDLAKETNINVESLQRLSFAAEQSGVSTEAVSKAAFNLQKSLENTPEKFEELGLSAQQLRAMRPEEQLVAISKALADVGDESEQAAKGAEIFGNGFRAILPLLRSDIAGLSSEAERLGFVLGEDTVSAGDKLGDELNKLTRSWEGLQDQLASVIVRNPELVSGIEDIASAIGSVAGSIKDHQKEFDILFKVLSGAVGGAGLKVLTRSLRETAHGITGAFGGKGKTGFAAGGGVTVTQAQTVTEAEIAASQRDVDAAMEQAQRKATAAREKAAREARAKFEADARAMSEVMKASSKDMVAFLSEQEKKAGGFGEKVLEGVLKAQAAQQQAMDEFDAVAQEVADAYIEADERAKAAFENMLRGIFDVANGFRFLGDVIGGSLGQALDLAGSVANAVGGITESVKGIQSAGGGLTGLLSKASGVLGIAGLGVGVVKQIAGLFSKPEHEKVMEDVGRDLGVRISDGLAKKIAEDSKSLGDRVAATLKNLGGIIDEAGGVKAFGTDKAIASTRDLFSALERGQLSAKDVGDTFEDVFGKILPEATNKATGRVSDDFRGLIALAKQFGIESKGVADFLSQQASTATSSLAEAIKGGVGTEVGAAGFGAAIAAQIKELKARGLSEREAIAQVQPAIQALRDELERTGFAGGAAFDAIAEKAGILAGEVTGPLVSKVDAIGNSLVALDNQGLLTQEIFSGLTAEVGATSEQLKAQGVEGPAALSVMQPSLQKIFELQQQYGFAVDETTQKLLDEAVAAGEVGDAHKSAQDQMVDSLERVAFAVEGLAKVFGVDLPAAAEKGAKGINDALGKVKIPDMAIPMKVGEVPIPGGGAVPGFASGGARDFGPVSFATLHGPEAILPARGGPVVDEVAGALHAALVRGGGAPQGGGGINLHTEVNVPVDAMSLTTNRAAFMKEVAQNVADGVRLGQSPVLEAFNKRGLK